MYLIIQTTASNSLLLQYFKTMTFSLIGRSFNKLAVSTDCQKSTACMFDICNATGKPISLNKPIFVTFMDETKKSPSDQAYTLVQRHESIGKWFQFYSGALRVGCVPDTTLCM
ncbi:hypothetical protein BATDEDRAFT_23221 [Batrachochytrium dendrobatidis JAM81]|uniref:Uncharacterized protein n=1 Tax=Batrachochytrium dendrobatidis (strain JAM81 / FGSC 10211) TaxID=684364 RepID=F4NYC7_BATDJ|nr:uncharacterized protein BATDEDRAFT_23221 [Batrachochytrium dendrobatidis JAM81]EGF81692.1 hypothetical protein BATDEDRAFT_23221 [Batrachochytrium dendrobatidis JAM81]|eukprot:XP_006677225.1 hypothetical protein BATDEDRAFT_23221 [Batrachochytrium dendrobatidis JAM81]